MFLQINYDSILKDLNNILNNEDVRNMYRADEETKYIKQCEHQRDYRSIKVI